MKTCCRRERRNKTERAGEEEEEDGDLLRELKWKQGEEMPKVCGHVNAAVTHSTIADEQLFSQIDL